MSGSDAASFRRLAHMIAKCEALQAWLEAVTFQMCNMTYNEMSEHLAGYVSSMPRLTS